MHRWLSPTVSLSQQVQLQSKSCQSHYRTKPLTAFTKSTIRKITRHLLKMYIVYLFSPHIDTFHIAMITSDGKYVFKKRKTFQKLWKIFDYNDWILSSFSILKKKSGDCCRCRRLSFPKTVHCCVTGLQIWPLYLSGCHMSSVFGLIHVMINDYQAGWKGETFVLAGRGVQLGGIATAPGIVTAEVCLSTSHHRCKKQWTC